ncbi:VC0807 family protein [Paenisporosarcina indica]|uniref:VC0807 family protein n=1 Tax=Paenisporosarcina indica TaxID=650093 RepID=UPI00094FF122|nr:VC0807 family protein [Paenisporosarcina indica]
MKSKFIILELIVFMALPYVIWTYGRDSIGDYYAMLLSTVPAFVYTVVRFVIDRQLNITGLFVISTLLLNTVVDLLSGSAINMLWNSVWLGYAFSAVYLGSMLFRKPLALYFAVDVMYLQGFPRENSKTLYFIKRNLSWFQLITAIFVLRGIVLNTLMAWLISKHGVDAFMHLIFLRKAISIGFGILIFTVYAYSGKIMHEYSQTHDIDWPVKETKTELEGTH